MQEGFQNFNKQNYDPNSLANMTSTVIMFEYVADISPSIRAYQKIMNDAATEIFMQDLKNSHRKNDIVVKCIAFNEDIYHKSGFTPITSLQDDYLKVEASGNGTALYQAVYEAMESAEQYRNDLEDQGVEVRTCLFIITDGENNVNHQFAAKVKAKVEALRKNEAWVSSYNIIMLGVGEDVNFRDACIKMGLDPDKCLVQVGATAKEIRKQMGVVSQSVSSSSAQSQNVSF